MEVKQNLCCEGEPVLCYRLDLPEPPEGCRRLARYFGEMERVWAAYWEKKVYPRACWDWEEKRAAARIFRPWSGELTGTITCQEETLYSVKLEVRQTQSDGRPCLVCWGENWDLRADGPLDVENLLKRGRGWQKRVLEEISAAGEARQRENLWFPDGDWREKAKKALKTAEPWVDEKSVFWSFPQGFMADPAEGNPVFSTTRQEETG